jgi:hypothetical protein
MIVIDPKATETAQLADFHLQVRPGRDAWLLAAMVAVIVQEDLVDHAWVADHAVGLDDVVTTFSGVPIAEYCQIAGVDDDLVRRATRRLAAASSVAVFEDLGVQMNRHSTLVSYLEKLVWVLTGNLGIAGGQYAPSTMVPLVRASKAELDPARHPTSPVTADPRRNVSSNVVPDEILVADRFRALIVSQTAGHSIADSQRMRGAICPRRGRHRRVRDRDGAWPTTCFRDDTVREVRVDVLHTVPAACSNSAVPSGRPVRAAPRDPCPPRQASGLVTDRPTAPARSRARPGAVREAFASAVAGNRRSDSSARRVSPSARSPTARRGLCCGRLRCDAQLNPSGVERGDSGPARSRRAAVRRDCQSPSGVVFTDDELDKTWRRIDR